MHNASTKQRRARSRRRLIDRTINILYSGARTLEQAVIADKCAKMLHDPSCDLRFIEGVSIMTEQLKHL